MKQLLKKQSVAEVDQEKRSQQNKQMLQKEAEADQEKRGQ